MDGQTLYRGVIIGLFSITLSLLGVIYSNISSGANEMSHRIDMLAGRINDIDHRLTAAETRLADMRNR
jgi:hypothetical protein